MREIKFRAWDGEKLRTNFFVQADGTKNRDVWDWKIMQYTGLKDKNGVEIYEGDIMGSPSNRNTTWRGEVFWDRDCWIIHGTDTIFSDHYEVIGNIYENPELLTKETN